MSKFEYEVLAGIDYPPNKRAEVGEIVSDLPKDSIPWLLSSGIIKEVDGVKPATPIKTEFVSPKVAPAKETEVTDAI